MRKHFVETNSVAYLINKIVGKSASEKKKQLEKILSDQLQYYGFFFPFSRAHQIDHFHKLRANNRACTIMAFIFQPITALLHQNSTRKKAFSHRSAKFAFARRIREKLYSSLIFEMQ